MVVGILGISILITNLESEPPGFIQVMTFLRIRDQWHISISDPSDWQNQSINQKVKFVEDVNTIVTGNVRPSSPCFYIFAQAL